MQLVLLALLALQGQQEPDKLKIPKSTTDEQLAEKLEGLTKLKSLDLEWCEKITDSGLAHLKGLTKLEKLNLDGTKITDEGLAHLKGLTKLEWLHLYSTAITDEGLVHLKRFSKLTHLRLAATTVTHSGVKRFGEALPDCEIEL